MDTLTEQTALAAAMSGSLETRTMAKGFLRTLKGFDSVLASSLSLRNREGDTTYQSVYVGEPDDTAALREIVENTVDLSALAHQASDETAAKEREIIFCPLVGHDGWITVLTRDHNNDALAQLLNSFASHLSNAISNCLAYEKVKGDLAHNRQSYELLKQERKRTHKLIESISTPIIRVDNEGKVLEINQSARDMLEICRQDLLSLTIGQLFKDHTAEKKNEAQMHSLNEALTNQDAWKSSEPLCVLTLSGKRKCIEISSLPIENANEKDGHIITLNDVTRAELVQLRASWQASHDPVTQLLNRGGFEAKLHQLFELSEQEQGRHALLHMDLDQFKVINDTCGHNAGDHLLQQVALLIRKELRDSDILGRLGGDEFGVVLTHCGPTKAKKIAHNICKSIAQYRFAWEERVFNPTISIGLTHFSPCESSADGTLKEADLACYAAKDGGRNGVYEYGQDKGASTSQRAEEMEWVSRINHAIEKDQFSLYCQSIFPLKAGQPVHIEILVRMIDGTKTILPGAFLPAAERYGKIQALDRWVVENSIKQIEPVLSQLDADYRFNINLAGPTLSDESSQRFILDLLSKHRAIASLLNFEITETSAVANLNSCISFIEACKRLGTDFVLDDFGTGLSSFVYLRQLPVSQVKIDGTFVKDICFDPVDQAMVIAMQQIGEALHIKTVAEYVEDQPTVELVQDIGIDYAQGYGLETPLPLSHKLTEIGQKASAKTA